MASEVAAECKRQWDMVQAMVASASVACKLKAKESHMHHTPALQLVYLLRNAGWEPNEATRLFAQRHYLRILSSRVVEEGHRAQNTFVRRNPVHRISNAGAHYAVQTSSLMKYHGFSPENERTGVAPLVEDVIDPAAYEPTRKHLPELLKALPGWSPLTAWHTTGPDGVNDSVADVLVALKLQRLEDMDRVEIFSCLVQGNRVMLQDVGSEQWC